MIKPLSYLEINSNNLLSNIESFKALLPSGNKLIAVVKANAYGHGLKEIVKIVDSKVDGFQVDDIEELAEARKYTDKPIYVFGYVMKKNLKQAIKLKGILGIYDLGQIKLLNKIGQENSEIIPIHLKIDALLGRQGILLDEVDNIASEIRKLSNVKVEAIYSHFSNLEDTENIQHAEKQHALLLEAKEKLGIKGIYHHISASSGFLVDQKNNWGGALVRLGIGMYGLWPSESLRNKYSETIKLTPVLRWITHVAQIKNVPTDYPIGYGLTHITKSPTTIAIIPQGYSDGYDRKLSNNSKVLIKGRKCPILGRVAMNMFVVDVRNVPDIAVEDEVVLLGTQGEDSITAEYLAEKAGTINYEIIARISALLEKRVK